MSSDDVLRAIFRLLKHVSQWFKQFRKERNAKVKV